ncbi:nickel/cobalt transporter [Modestobacter sp. VKM Ac-2978]|uniref:nickel/cobalt transporter n=1 Tax=Modestobacter sp. VKM Ac-2978 TaxID=3004132 RepID=UPI0022AB0323|nr:hypothetical protein [Modestobacter sp. VKM Ac-2978]MCZ2850339.1 hypothetical protein [Modestobacter sp. VKM Ac-2978]
MLACLICTSGLVVTAGPALAHPLGDFTVNTHIGVRVEPAAVVLDVVVDIAEVPTLRAFPGLDAASAAAGDAVSEADQRAYRERMCPALRDAVDLQVGGAQVELADDGSSLSFPPGSAGLATARLECTLRSVQELDTVGQEVVLIDRMAVQPVGWREITAVGDGVELAASDVPDRSVSDVLRNYPEDLLDDPLDQRGATLSVVAGSGIVTGPVAGPGGGPGPEPLRGLDPMTTAFMDLVSATQLSVGYGALAIVLALLLGSLHAVAPGHGKTLMAAYLVGREGSLRQAAVIGASVTVTHTAGVLVLGVLLSVAAVTAPERVYPWLSLASGLLLVMIGLALLRGAWRRRSSGTDDGHAHAHAHGHGHGHNHGHGGDLATASATREGAAAPGPVAVATSAGAVARPGDRGSSSAQSGEGVRGGHRSLLAVGFAGGLVPSPSALVVLLGGIALGRAWFGVLLVLAYGIGMALALMGAGLLVVRARDRVERWSSARHLSGGRTGAVLAVARALPLLTAVLVVVIGVGLAVRALAQV